MKKFQLYNWLLIAFIAFQFSACENEPLEGEFPQDEDVVNVEEGGFVATVEGEGFTAETASGIITSENFLTLTGVTSSGETIVLAIEQAAVGVFDITAGLGNLNSGSYSGDDFSPYISAGVFGGSGTLTILEMDNVALTVTGTFSFTGIRIAVDTDGNPILDGDGNPVLEEIVITSGEFNKISYVLDDESGEGTPIVDDFFAKVDGVGFIPVAITPTLNEIAGENIVKIVAVNEEGAIMRIDIPEELGVGTFAMESLSDGTKLISLYNSNTGGENLTSNPGTITITRFNVIAGIIEATFSFTATDPINMDPTVHEITEGSFKVDYLVTDGETITSFTAEVDETPFDPDSILIEETSFNGISRFSITVIETDIDGFNKKMGLFFPVDIEVGTYDMTNLLIDGTEKFGQYSPDFGNSVDFRSATGTLTIIDYDHDSGIIQGTFSFTASDILNQDPNVYEVTNGEFTLELL